ncbi:hypothetical protein CLOM_g3537 [Closterium sp. NIES-68]|nr:hypothetical protein CLOM_g3537 [Closterium sp. NIES-68]
MMELDLLLSPRSHLCVWEAQHLSDLFPLLPEASEVPRCPCSYRAGGGHDPPYRRPLVGIRSREVVPDEFASPVGPPRGVR